MEALPCYICILDCFTLVTGHLQYCPLFASDITFIHEGNKTFLDNLLNFDKLVSRLGERCLVTLHVRGLVISCVSTLCSV